MSVNNINSLINTYNSGSSVSKTASTSKMYDHKAAQQSANAYVAEYKNNKATVNTLKKETADFLTSYTNGMNELSKTSAKLTNSGITNILYNEAGKTSEASINKTVDAVKDMVNSYNKNLKTLNDNSERGAGVLTQLARMVDDPAAKQTMEMAGIKVNKDATLSFDAEKLKKSLSGTNSLEVRLVADSIETVASSVLRDARAGLNMPAGKLVNNDIAKMQEIKNNNSFTEMYQSIRGGGAYYMNNSAVAGMMMNLLV